MRDRVPGRMSRLPLPDWMHDRLRRIMRRPLQHRSPGSEWPTHSGLITDEEREAIAEFAQQTETSTP